MPSDENYSVMGFTFQKTVCDLYGITPEAEQARSAFRTNYDPLLSKRMTKAIESIFNEIGHDPVSCHTMVKTKNRSIPYNFTLDDKSTLSIRTNMIGDKVAPREVGQAGFEKLDYYFGDIYGKTITSQEDMKELFIYHTDQVVPIFINHFLDADYIIWIRFQDGKLVYDIIKKKDNLSFVFEPDGFSFTRGLDEWKESTTLKYKGNSIAEIQMHKNRSFKFRFQMKHLLPLMHYTHYEE